MMEPAVPPNPNQAPAFAAAAPLQPGPEASFTVTGPAVNINNSGTQTPVAAEGYVQPPTAAASAPAETAYAQAPAGGSMSEGYVQAPIAVSATAETPQYTFQADPTRPAQAAPEGFVQQIAAPDAISAQPTPTPDPLSPKKAVLNFHGSTSPDGQIAQTAPTINSGAELTPAASTQSAPPESTFASTVVPDLSAQLNALPTTPAEAMPGLAVSDQAKAMNSFAGNTSVVGQGEALAPNPTETFSQMAGNVGPENQDGKEASRTRIATMDEVITDGKKGLPQVEGTKLEGPFLQGFSIAIGTAAAHRN